MKIISKLKEMLSTQNLSSPREKSTKKILIYDKTIPLVNVDTEGRQKFIKSLLKEDNISLSDDLFMEPLLFECDVKEPEFKSKSKILEVFIIKDYNYTVGYITNEYNELFSDELHNNTSYSTMLYVSKEDNVYTLELNIKFYKNSN